MYEEQQSVINMVVAASAMLEKLPRQWFDKWGGGVGCFPAFLDSRLIRG
jgi:hypothetical protein